MLTTWQRSALQGHGVARGPLVAGSPNGGAQEGMLTQWQKSPQLGSMGK